MSGWRPALALAAIAAICPSPAASSPCPADPAESLRPCDLEVVGGEEEWHSENVFSLRWRNPPRDGAPPIAAVHYRLLDSSLEVVQGERRIDRAAQLIERVTVPPAPGVYTAEVWLEDASGAHGSPSAVRLRFDDARPGSVDPLPTPEWIGRPDFPYPVRLGPPAGPRPLSGLRGYAVAVDREPESDPCGAAARCSEAETVLPDTAERTLWLTSLPEGTSHVHSVGVSGSGMKSARIGHRALRVDTTAPTTTLSGVPSGWANRPVTLVATASDAASGMTPRAGAVNPFTAIRLDGGAPILAEDESVQARVIASGIHTVAYYARDTAGNVDDGGGANGRANPPPPTATVRVDLEPPHVSFQGFQDPGDPETIRAPIHDPLSGPSRERGQIALRPAGSGGRFEPLPTSVEKGGLRARWDSEAYPAGLYEFQAIGFDRAGNESVAQLRANGSRMILSAPLKSATVLRAVLVKRRSPRRLRIGADAALEGRLTAGRRSPLAAMTVRVVERFAAGTARRERVSVLRTDERGAFALRLAPGPSREVVASFPGTATLGRSQSAPLSLGVSGAVRMSVSAPVATIGGRPVAFKGRVAGAIPPQGKQVELQFRLPGEPWTEFRTIETDSRGRFRYAYRFSDDDSRGVRFQFRAYASAQDDWPYEPAGSRPVVVRGR